jgi:hypothetical protein
MENRHDVSGTGDGETRAFGTFGLAGTTVTGQLGPHYSDRHDG